MAISDTQMLFGTPADTDLHADKTYLTIAASVTMIVMSILAVFLRFISRRVIRVPFGLDDWLILAALPFALMLPAIDLHGVYQGYFGRHIIIAPPDYLPVLLIGLYVYDIAYNFAIALTKLSMLAIYWRIFHAESFKLPLLITAGVTLAWLISCTLVAIFSCMPVQGFWNRTIEATCINNFAFYIGQAACNIVLDVVIFIIPIFRVSRLSITAPQKAAVSGIFLLGLFTTIASALRLNELIRSLFVTMQDPSYELVGSGVWSVIETNLSIVCACLPTMRPLLRLALKGTPFPTTRGTGAYGPTRSGGLSRSDSRAKNKNAASWPLPKRLSGIVSPTRPNFAIPEPDNARASPANVSFSRPFVPNAHSFTSDRYYEHIRGGRDKNGGDIELEERQAESDGKERAYDEVSQFGGSTGTADTDGIKYLQETRPVDGF